MKAVKYILCLMIALLAIPSSSNAQNTPVFTGIGSSALFLELGKAAVARAGERVTGETTCSWSTKDSGGGVLANEIYANDQAPGIQNTGNFWVVYTTSDATCATLTGTVDIWSYLQEDSAVGNRCIYRSGSTSQECILVIPAAATGTVTNNAGANLITGHTDIAFALPAGIITALNGTQFGVAGSDVRPEDSQFQLYRALSSTSTVIQSSGGGAKYDGLGLAASSTSCPSPSGSPVSITITGGSHDGGSSGVAGNVTAALFALPGGTDPCTGAAGPFTQVIFPVGATPVVVAVNNTDSRGFGASAITNITRAELAGFLDGALCRPADLNTTVAASSPSSTFSTTFIREPFSGTYTTMEYQIPANAEIQGSQESGIASPTTQPTTWTTCNNAGGVRSRVTSTGNMVFAIENNTDALGYAFWSVANFAGFTSSTGTPTNGKYLTVDGIDPILPTYQNGCIPIAGESTYPCTLASITFTHVKDGTYPIWSIQRLVLACATKAGCAPPQQGEAKAMTLAAQGEVSTTPDFVPVNKLYLFRSHFLPPTPASLQGSITVANGTCSGSTEAGGDVAGAVYTTQSDVDYCSDFGVSTGQINQVGSNPANAATGNGNPGQRQ